MATIQPSAGLCGRLGARNTINLRAPLITQTRTLRPLGLLRSRRVVPCTASASISVAQPSSQQKEGGSGEQKGFKKWITERLEWWNLESPLHGEEQTLGKSTLRPLLSKILELCSPDKWLLMGAAVFMVVAAVCELAIPHFATKSIFAAAVPGATRASYMAHLNWLVAMVVFYGVFAATRGYCFSILNNRMTMRLRTQLFSNLVRRETAFFDSTDVGTLTSRLQADCQAVTKCIATNLNIALRNGLQALGGIMYLWVLSKELCLVTLAISAILWGVTLIYGDFARRAQKVYQDVLACGNQVADEVLTQSKTVRTFGTERQEEKRYEGWLGRLYQVGLRQATGYSLFVMAGHISCYATKVAALILGCGMVLRGTLSAEQLTNFVFYVEFVTYASLNVCDEFTEFMEALGASERVVKLLQAPPAAEIGTGRTLPEFSGRVNFKDVSFRYPTRPKNLVLDQVSLELAPGQMTAFVGLSGSGKSTVVALLQRLYDPMGGAILIDGVDLREVDGSWFRAQIGVVSQDPKLFSTTVAENIAYGCDHIDPSQEEIEEAARQANAHDFIMTLPKGYETPVTDRLLSGGQRQRIALARALIRKPKVLILDEATSALDAESEAQVQAALDCVLLAKERTVVMIAHRLSTVRNADTIIVMDKGKVSEVGSHDSLVRQGGIYSQLVSRQVQGMVTIGDITGSDRSMMSTDEDLLRAGSVVTSAAIISGNGSSSSWPPPHVVSSGISSNGHGAHLAPATAGASSNGSSATSKLMSGKAAKAAHHARADQPHPHSGADIDKGEVDGRPRKAPSPQQDQDGREQGVAADEEEEEEEELVLVVNEDAALKQRQRLMNQGDPGAIDVTTTETRQSLDSEDSVAEYQPM